MMRRARTLMTALVCLCLPRAAKPAALRALGHSVAAGVRIGPSLVLTERLALAKGASIGAFNFLALRRLLLREGAAIGSMNVIKRGQSALLKRRAAIGNRNVILRGLPDGAVEVSAVDPVASMAAVENADLAEVAGKVREMLREAVEGV